MLDTSEVTFRNLFDNKRMPLLVEALPRKASSKQFFAENNLEIETLLLKHGAIIFRGFEISSIRSFSEVISSLQYRPIVYEYRSTPRTELYEAIYTASEYPAKQFIGLHCENAYQRDWPTKILFACTLPAEGGGQTPLADIIAVSQRLPSDYIKMFEQQKVCYIRNYHEGLDLSWQNVFQTKSKLDVAKICDRLNIEFEWISNKQLRTKQISQGVADHFALQKKVFFNQAHIFHVSNLGESIAQALIDSIGVENLPRHACFGNMLEISPSQLAQIREAYDAEKITFDWQRGDLLLVDNMQVAHGREPFTGKRQVLAALCDLYSDVRRFYDLSYH